MQHLMMLSRDENCTGDANGTSIGGLAFEFLALSRINVCGRSEQLKLLVTLASSQKQEIHYASRKARLDYCRDTINELLKPVLALSR
jgi:hypothetical protein